RIGGKVGLRFASTARDPMVGEKRLSLLVGYNREAKAGKKKEPLNMGEDRGRSFSKQKEVLFVGASRKREDFITTPVFSNSTSFRVLETCFT
ncbi:MAG: hypothetical protein SNJ78_05270, partial [Spirochaetales bacterium]